MPDPLSISADSWNEIGKWLQALWLYFLLILVFAFSFLVAHAVIPSLVSTGHLPQRYMKMRRLAYAVALVAFVGAMVFLSYAAILTQLLGDIYDRWWI